MEWLVKKSCCNKQDNRHVLMLCDAGGAIKMIAEVKSDFAVKVGIYSRLCRMRFIVLIVKSCIR
ncbi:polymyxin B resistance protein PmrD [Escherichia coli]|nr:polymyxin B resistance protein PmrD [Escherichia coli]